MEIRNVTSRVLEIAATGQVVDPWDSVEVDDELGRQLTQQVDVWRTGEGPERPTKSSTKAEWVAYATAQGLDDAESMTKDELVAHFDQPEAPEGEEG